MASEAYHDWSGEAVGARLRVGFTLKLLLSQNFCNQHLMRFISFASNIGPTAVVPAGPAPAPLQMPAVQEESRLISPSNKTSCQIIRLSHCTTHVEYGDFI